MKTFKHYIAYLTAHTVVRYILAGGTSAVINLVVLSVMYYRYHIHYLIAATAAFFVAFCFSVLVHKFWTFKDYSRERMHVQMGKYLLSSLFGLLLNDLFLYVCVHFLHIYVFVGEIIAGALVACVTYFISKHLIFKK